MPTYQAVYSPAGSKPSKLLYVNRDGSFFLNEGEGKASYVWPPDYDANGNLAISASRDAYLDDLLFERYTQIQAPATMAGGPVTDDGWVFKVKDETMWFFFGTRTFVKNGQTLHRLYYSFDGTNFSRWYTEDGTRRSAVARLPATDPQTIGGGQSVDPSSPNTIRIDLGEYTLPNEIRFPCPSFKHLAGDTRDHKIRIYMQVSHPSINTVKDDIADCARGAGVAALLAAAVATVTTGGGGWAAASATFMTTFKVCVSSKLGAAAANMTPDVKYEEFHGDWSGH